MSSSGRIRRSPGLARPGTRWPVSKLQGPRYPFCRPSKLLQAWRALPRLKTFLQMNNVRTLISAPTLGLGHIHPLWHHFSGPRYIASVRICCEAVAKKELGGVFVGEGRPVWRGQRDMFVMLQTLQIREYITRCLYTSLFPKVSEKSELRAKE